MISWALSPETSARASSAAARVASPEAAAFNIRSMASSEASPDDGIHIGHVDFGLACRIKRELLHLAARQRAVGAKACEQQFPRVGRDRKLVARQRLADEPLKVVAFVPVTSHGCGGGRLFKQGAHRVGGAQVARFHDERCRQCVAFDQRCQRRGRHAAAGDGAHDLGAAEHRYGLKLHGKTIGVLVEIRLVEANDLAIVARGDERR